MKKSWHSTWLKMKNIAILLAMVEIFKIFWSKYCTLQWPYCWQGRNILQHPRFSLRSGSSQTWKSKLVLSSPTKVLPPFSKVSAPLRKVISLPTKVSSPLRKLSSPKKYHHQSSPLFIEDKSWIPLTGHASSPCELYKGLLLTLENYYFNGDDGDDHRSSFWPILVFVKRSYC